MRNHAVTRFGIWALFFLLACKGGETSAPTDAPSASAQETAPAKETKPVEAPKKAAASTTVPDSLPTGLLLAYSQFEVVDGAESSAYDDYLRMTVLGEEGQLRVRFHREVFHLDEKNARGADLLHPGLSS